MSKGEDKGSMKKVATDLIYCRILLSLFKENQKLGKVNEVYGQDTRKTVFLCRLGPHY